MMPSHTGIVCLGGGMAFTSLRNDEPNTRETSR